MYQDYDSDSDVPEELKQDYVDEQTGDAPLKRSVPSQIVAPLWWQLAQGMTSEVTWSAQVSIISTPSNLKSKKDSEHGHKKGGTPV